MRKADYVYVDELEENVNIIFCYMRRRFLWWSYTPRAKSVSIEFSDVFDVELDFIDGLFCINVITRSPSCLNKDGEIENENINNRYGFPELTLDTARILYLDLTKIALENNIESLGEIDWESLDDDDDDDEYLDDEEE